MSEAKPPEEPGNAREKLELFDMPRNLPSLLIWIPLIGAVAWIWIVWVDWTGREAWRIAVAILATALLSLVYDWVRQLLRIKTEAERELKDSERADKGDERATRESSDCQQE